MPITALPTAPSRALRPADFANQADTFLAALPAFGAEANALADEVNGLHTATETLRNETQALRDSAATHAANAASSATSAATSASDAAASAASAATSAANASIVGARYLGAKASDPTTDNSGNPLEAGALYWNTTSNHMRVWSGSAWQQAAGSLTTPIASTDITDSTAIGRALLTAADAAAARALVPIASTDITDSTTIGRALLTAADAAAVRALVPITSTDTATKLQTARTITIGNTGKSFDGSANVSWSLAEIGAAGFGILAEDTDLNTVVNPGFYRLVGTHGNAPAGVSWGQLIVARGGSDTILQIVTGYSNGEIYWRQGNPPDVGGPGSWSAWHRFFHSGNLNTEIYAPAGMVAYFARNTAPSGWLKANGAAVSRTTYAALFAAIGTTFGAGDGSTTFNLPDLRGEFLRSWDEGRGVDSWRVFGTVQLDAMQGHGHANRSLRIGGTGGTGEFLGANNRPEGDTRTSRITTPVSDGINGTPRTATETRPRNVALLACIKF